STIYSHIPLCIVSISFISDTSFTSSFSSTAPANTYTYTLSLHDALPILNRFISIRSLMFFFYESFKAFFNRPFCDKIDDKENERSEEHTSELQSRFDLVCRLLLEKKKIKQVMICSWSGVMIRMVVSRIQN